MSSEVKPGSDQQKLQELLDIGYTVGSVHRETTGDFNIRLVYAGHDKEHELYRSVVTRDEDTVKLANRLMQECGTCG